MTGPEIRDRIIKNNHIIEDEARHGTFVLSAAAQEAMAENEDLRAQCPHSYSTYGFCIYCGGKL